jgi:hypothetical protein
MKMTVGYLNCGLPDALPDLFLLRSGAPPALLPTGLAY